MRILTPLGGMIVFQQKLGKSWPPGWKRALVGVLYYIVLVFRNIAFTSINSFVKGSALKFHAFRGLAV